MAKLGDICNILNGYAFQSDKYVDSGIRVIRITNVQKGYIEDSDPKFYPIEYLNELSKFILENGDLLMSLTGNVGRVGTLTENFLPAALNQRVACLRLKSNKILKQYLFHILNSDYFEQMCTNASNGIAQKNLSTEWLKDFQIPEYSIDKQAQIATTLDKVTTLISLRQKQLKKFDELVKSRFIEMFGSIIERCKLEEYAELITKGASPKWQGIDYAEEGTLFVTSENVRDGYLDFTKKKYLPNDINKILPRSVLKRNDILINIVNASIGRVAVYDSDELANINQAVALVRLKPNTLNITFLLTYLNSDEALRAYDYMKVGGDKANLSLKNISDLMIPVVDMEQQQQFATFVEQTDKSKLAVQKSLEQLETLKKSLMQKYFN